MRGRAGRIVLIAAVMVWSGCGNEGDDGTSGTEGTSSGTAPSTTRHDAVSGGSDPNTFTNTTNGDSVDTSGTGGAETGGDATATTGGATTTDTDSGDTGATTTDGTTGGELGNCCSAHDGGGCDDAVVESCVCDEDPFCCDMGWDDVCVVDVVILGCGTCPGVGGDGDCCAANDTPGCDDDSVEACVCEADYMCCLAQWDQLCADQVTSLQCGQC